MSGVYPSRPGRRRPPPAATAPAPRYGRRRAAAAGLALLVLVAVAWFATGHGGRAAGAGKAPAPVRTVAAPVSLPAAESGLLPWQLPGPLSREVVVPGSPGRLIVLGGLVPGGASSDAVYALRTATGAARRVGTLSAPVHDVAAAEINGSWVSEYTPAGQLSWTVRLPISYPSDPQQLGPDRYLIADYASPGQILEFNRAGRILYRYDDPSGPGELNHPSLAELLPSGVFMLNDDYNDRMVAIDPATGALVWQYGITGTPGTARGQLNTPDGFDLLLPNGSTPTHATTG